jgi:hypothetical protein
VPPHFAKLFVVDGIDDDDLSQEKEEKEEMGYFTAYRVHHGTD